MSDVIDTPTVEEETYPTPDKVYVKKGRCIYCGSKKIKVKWGYEWCDKPCKLGANALDIYERKNHLGDYEKNGEELESE